MSPAPQTVSTIFVPVLSLTKSSTLPTPTM
jgi:hypothetical protein